jgi:tetratricopeptide (TPR) repeat protein
MTLKPEARMVASVLPSLREYYHSRTNWLKVLKASVAGTVGAFALSAFSGCQHEEPRYHTVGVMFAPSSPSPFCYQKSDDFKKGEAAFEAKEYEKAITLLSVFIEGNPLNIYVNEGALLMGRAAEKTKKYDLAVEAYSRVIDSPESPFDYKDSAYMGRGNSFFEMDRFKEALADYRTVETNYMTAENYNINPAEVKMKIELTKKMINSSPTK